MKNIKLKRLTQKNSAYQGQPSDPHIYEYGDYIIDNSGQGQWTVFKGADYIRVELNYGLWDIALDLSKATVVFPNPFLDLPVRHPISASLKDCKEWITKGEL